MLDPSLIYIVDDQADYRLIVQQIFVRCLPNYSVRLFDSGHTLLSELTHSSVKPSLILLDRHMPGLDGHQTLLRLKTSAVYKTIPVVMMSADASAQEINGCYEAGANSFLVKRLDFTLMNELLEGVCRYWIELNQQPIAI